MALCLPAGCGCAIQSSSITITGDGSPGVPYVLTALGTHVCTSGTRPTGIQGLEIWETDTLRSLIYDGTNWVIQSGQMPGCSVYITSGSQSVSNATFTTINLATEVYDIGGFHTSTNGFFTVPSGMAGDYTVHASTRFNVNDTGPRITAVGASSNGSITNAPVIRDSLWATDGLAGATTTLAYTIRLVAGAVLTLQGYQGSGGALTVLDAYMTLDMIRHIPSLT